MIAAIAPDSLSPSKLVKPVEHWMVRMGWVRQPGTRSGCLYTLWVLFVGVLLMRALPFGVYKKAVSGPATV